MVRQNPIMAVPGIVQFGMLGSLLRSLVVTTKAGGASFSKPLVMPNKSESLIRSPYKSPAVMV
ncbi:MAG: hypothetical protein RL717_623 [Pseudomonadota bacterium]